MSSGFAAMWEACDTRTALGSWLDELASFGWGLVNPVSGKSVRLDHVGEDIPFSDPSRLSDVVDEDGLVTLQLWRDPNADLLWALQRIDDRVQKAWISFSGLSAENRGRVLDMLLTRFRRLAKEGTLEGLVVDQGGDSAEFNWDAFILRREGAPPLLPEIVGLREDSAKPVTARSPIYREEHVGHCVLLYAAQHTI